MSIFHSKTWLIIFVMSVYHRAGKVMYNEYLILFKIHLKRQMCVVTSALFEEK